MSYAWTVSSVTHRALAWKECCTENQSTNVQFIFYPENKQGEEMLSVNIKLFEVVAYLSAHFLVLGVREPGRLL